MSALNPGGGVCESGLDGSEFSVEGGCGWAPVIVVVPCAILKDGEGEGCFVIMVVERSVGVDCNASGLVLCLFNFLLQIPNPCLEGCRSLLWRVGVYGYAIGVDVADPLARTA